MTYGHMDRPTWETSRMITWRLIFSSFMTPTPSVLLPSNSSTYTWIINHLYPQGGHYPSLNIIPFLPVGIPVGDRLPTPNVSENDTTDWDDLTTSKETQVVDGVWPHWKSYCFSPEGPLCRTTSPLIGWQREETQVVNGPWLCRSFLVSSQSSTNRISWVWEFIRKLETDTRWQVQTLFNDWFRRSVTKTSSKSVKRSYFDHRSKQSPGQCEQE